MPCEFSEMSLKEIAVIHLAPFKFRKYVAIVAVNDYSEYGDPDLVLDAGWWRDIFYYECSPTVAPEKIVDLEGRIVFEHIEVDENNIETDRSAFLAFSKQSAENRNLFNNAHLGNHLPLCAPADATIEQTELHQKRVGFKSIVKIVHCIYKPFVHMPDDFDTDDAAIWHNIESLRLTNPWSVPFDELPRLIHAGKEVVAAITEFLFERDAAERLANYEKQRAAGQTE